MADETEGNAKAWQELGKPSAEIDKAKPPVKRSQTVSLVLLAGAGLAAVELAKLDWSQHDEEVLVYADPDACIAAQVRSEADCRSDYARAKAAYPSGAPRYSTLTACEAHHGAGHCVPGESVAESARGQFVPRMAAYFLGREAEQGVEPEAVYEHQPEHGGSGSSSGGGYCRGSGGRILTGGGYRSSVARVASSSLRRASFGGFGGTGRSFSSSSRGGFGG